MRFRKKPVVVEAYRWFKNGDHPNDHRTPDPELQKTWPDHDTYVQNVEGCVVRRYRHPGVDGSSLCISSIPCKFTMHEHGWIDTPEGGHTVCPGDWIITGIKGEVYPCKPDIFAATYEPAEQPQSSILTRPTFAVDVSKLASVDAVDDRLFSSVPTYQIVKVIDGVKVVDRYGQTDDDKARRDADFAALRDAMAKRDKAAMRDAPPTLADYADLKEALTQAQADAEADRNEKKPLRARIDELMGRLATKPPDAVPPSGPLGRFTDRARKVLSLATVAAKELNHNYVGTEHLLLGLAREENGLARNILNDLGVETWQIHDTMMHYLGRGGTTNDPRMAVPEPPTPAPVSLAGAESVKYANAIDMLKDRVTALESFCFETKVEPGEGINLSTLVMDAKP